MFSRSKYTSASILHLGNYCCSTYLGKPDPIIWLVRGWQREVEGPQLSPGLVVMFECLCFYISFVQFGQKLVVRLSTKVKFTLTEGKTSDLSVQLNFKPSSIQVKSLRKWLASPRLDKHWAPWTSLRQIVDLTHSTMTFQWAGSDSRMFHQQPVCQLSCFVNPSQISWWYFFILLMGGGGGVTTPLNPVLYPKRDNHRPKHLHHSVRSYVHPAQTTVAGFSFCNLASWWTIN